MSQPAGDEPTTAAADDNEIQKPYNAKAQTRDCCNFILFITFLVFITGAVPAVTTVLIYLQPSLPIFAVNSSTVSIVRVSSSQITARWDLKLTVTNPKDNAAAGFSYDRLVVYAVGGGAHNRLANFSIPTPFRQPGRGNTASLSASFPSIKFAVDDCTNNATVFRQCAPVQLSVELEAAAVYEGPLSWPDKSNSVKVECNVADVTFKPNSPTTSVGPAACRSDGRWRRLADKCRDIFWKYVYVVAMCFCILAFSL
ncbi:hypothetical protein LINGRAHAP2_LOCUS29971 [Linum grandiflorum]